MNSNMNAVRLNKMKINDQKKIKKQEDLNEIASHDLKLIALNGHKDCDEAYGIWMTPDGRFVRFTIGEVRRAKEQLELESE